MSEHLGYLTKAGLVNSKRVPKKATKIRTLETDLLADLIDVVQHLDASRSERAEARKVARRAELAEKLAEIEQRVRREVREELHKEAALLDLLQS
jgi:DNA-binding transcriptional ArsR family regulator